MGILNFVSLKGVATKHGRMALGDNNFAVIKAVLWSFLSFLLSFIP